jgi:hypothetical protein
MCQPWHYNISTSSDQGKTKGSILCKKTCSKVAPNYHKIQGGEKGSFVAIINIKTRMEMASIDRLKD